MTETEGKVTLPTGQRRHWLPSPRLLVTRVLHVLLWLLVAVGAVGGVSAWTLAASADPPAADPVEVAVPSVPAQGFAELYVRAWLGEAGRGSEDAIAAFYPESVGLGDVTPGGVYVADVATVDVAEEAAGYWAVTIAAAVLTAVDGVYEPGGVRYYTVGVVEANDGLVATGLPAQVNAPSTLEDAPAPVAGMLGSVGEEPWVEAVERFLGAYLAGAGEVDRYTAPGVNLAALIPPPYVEVRLQRAGAVAHADGRRTVRVEASAVDAGGLTHVMHYSLSLAERAGRWEVTELHPAPPLSE